MSQHPFDRTTKIRRASGPLSSDLGQDSKEVVVLDTKSNQYFGLDSVAGHIWNKLVQPISLGELVDSVVAEYEVEEERCFSDTLSFVQDLQDKGLVTIEQ